MLVLTRKAQERIQIGDNVTITILRVQGRSIRVGIEAPRAIRIVRGELPQTHTDEKTTDAPLGQPHVPHQRSCEGHESVDPALDGGDPLAGPLPCRSGGMTRLRTGKGWPSNRLRNDSRITSAFQFGENL
jgi:carbon storage regulator CsrA